MIDLNDLKIILSGLDNAGKTSILTALDKKYDFQKKTRKLKPTVRVKYHQIKFLGKNLHFWDMGGQEKYRELYESRLDVYLDKASLFIYIIDIQDSARYESSIEYLTKLLSYIEENELDIPLIVAFHKFDPELKDDNMINKNVHELSDKIIKLKQLKMLFLQTSIYDIYSIMHLVSSALSIFNVNHLKLKELSKNYLKDLSGKSIIIFDQNGFIISEYYTDSLDHSVYLELLNSNIEQIILLKKIQEKQYKYDYGFTQINSHSVAYLHKIKFENEIFYVSILIDEIRKEKLQNKISDFLNELNVVLKPILT